MQLELRLSGSGGQGLITAGIILAEAALADGKNAVQTQSYGPEARGGASKAEVIISDEIIDFPKVTRPNLILALTQDAAAKYVDASNSDAMVIVDESVELSPETGLKKLFRVPIIDTARHEIGREIVANIVALGLIVGLTQIVSQENLEATVIKRLPRGTEDLNRMALQAGYDLAKQI
ncbi:MAG: 2-oxoglutarate ferredoxin oxidoreductase subunit gamma [Clostridiales bacterium]|nr:2-oxoglutarate ferredoxin oxidoreductase subunit gamma [Clostridiales bacterium]